MVIRENELYKRVASVIKDGLDSLGVGGYAVLQTQQPNPTSSHCVVTIHKISDRRYGWQGSTFSQKPDDNIDQMTETVDYINEATFQVAAFCPRKASDSVKTMTSGDVVSALHMWINSDVGLTKMHEFGLQLFRSTDIRNPEFADDSNTPQFNPNFDMRVVTYNESDFRIGAINDPDAVEKSVHAGGPLMNPPLHNIIQGHYTESGKM